MSLIDLPTEFSIALDALTRKHRERLMALGIDAAAVATAGGIGIARVLRRADGLFEPVERDQGEAALIWPIWTGSISEVGYCEGDLIDLLAWHPAQPELFHRRIGDAPALGLAAIERSWDSTLGGARPLSLYRTPIAWARAGGGCVARESAGAVILDWGVDSGLFNAASILAEDLEHGEFIEHRLKLLRWKIVPPMPPIKVRSSEVSNETAKKTG